jgi:hypothetical protein
MGLAGLRSDLRSRDVCDHARGAGLNGLCRSCGARLAAEARPARSIWSVDVGTPAGILLSLAFTVFVGGIYGVIGGGFLLVCCLYWHWATGEA